LQGENGVAEPEGSSVKRPPFQASEVEVNKSGKGEIIRLELLAFRENVKRPENAIVIANEWPSWLFVLPGMGFDNIHVWISTLVSQDIEESIRSQFTFHDIYSIDDVNEYPDPVFFLAGPEDYIVETMRGLDASKPMWVAVVGHLRQHPRVGESFKWAEVRHAHTGGVTTCRSWIGQNQFNWWDHPPEQDPNHRRLRDVLSMTELGLVSEAPEQLKRDKRILFPDDLLPTGAGTGMVIAPSVFSPTKWTK
jgi:hypothetical protein